VTDAHLEGYYYKRASTTSTWLDTARG